MQTEVVISNLKQENEVLKDEVDRLKGIILLLKRGKFTSTSERVIDLDPQQILFNEIEKEALTPEVLETNETVRVTYDRKKGRGQRKPFPENFPREEKIIDLPEEQKTCPHDGTRLHEIGEERSEKFKVIPAQMSVVVQIKKKYACATCASHLAQAKSHSILPGTIATPELLSFIVFSKFFQALPLYRLEELFKINGVDLKRGTMARWLIQVTEKLMPIYNLLAEKAFESGYMAIDATHVQVLKEPGRQAEAKSFMWARGSPEKGIILFDYDSSGGGQVAKKLVTGFSGALQADAHRGYNALDRAEILLLGCMMHARRRFHDAFLLGGKKQGLANEAVLMFKWLYEREEDYKKRGLSPVERKEMRDQEMKPSLEIMKQWCESKIAKVLKSSPLGNALHYFINEYAELTAFLSNGRYEMDNGWVERTIRKFAIGRNNWMFCDTVAGAHASSLLYSLTITAKLNGKNPIEVLTKIFEDLPKANTIEDYEVLTNLLLSAENTNSCLKKEG